MPQCFDVGRLEIALRLRRVERVDHVARGDGQLVLEDPQEVVALRVDGRHPRAILPDAVDEIHAAEEDRETARRVPRDGRKLRFGFQ